MRLKSVWQTLNDSFFHHDNVAIPIIDRVIHHSNIFIIQNAALTKIRRALVEYEKVLTEQDSYLNQ